MVDQNPVVDVRQAVDSIYRTDSRRIFATLVKFLRDFDIAEEAMHEAFAIAVEKWSTDGIPDNPRAWLVSTGRFKAIDTLRRRTRLDATLQEVAYNLNQKVHSEPAHLSPEIEDDRLRLIFTCCHPALGDSTQVALTLREVCGLTTEEIAGAFLTSTTNIAQRIVRGKAKIRDAGIPYKVPEASELPERIASVLSVIYLVFNEGYSASSGQNLIRTDLTDEAIRLGRLLLQLLPDPEVMGLLALMLLQESRRHARTSATGDLILLEHQDRKLWNHSRIEEGSELVRQALATRQFGIYTIQAAIAAVHSTALTPEQTDWPRIVSLYDLLLTASPSPVIELNRAVAVAMSDGPAAGLQLIDEILSRKELLEYHLIHAARADLCRRLDRKSEARDSYLRALNLAKQEPERRFLEKRLQELQ